MAVRQPKYSKEEFRRRGEEIYETKIRPWAEKDHLGEIAAIDIETGEYEIDKESIVASDRLLARLPDAQVWYERIGYNAVLTFGPRLQRTS